MATKKKKYHPPASRYMPVSTRLMLQDYKSDRETFIYTMGVLRRVRKSLPNTLTGRKKKKEITKELTNISRLLKKTRRAIHYYTR
jgi:hypothetical protein